MKIPIRVFLLAFLMSLLLVNTPAQAADWEGPVLVSFELSPTQIDVSNNSSFVTIKAHLTDSTGVSFMIVQIRTGLGGTGGGPDITMSRCAGSQTDCTLTGKVVLAKRSRPGNYYVAAARASDTLNNGSIYYDVKNSFEVLNTAGNPDPSEVPQLPAGVKPEDYAPDWLLVKHKEDETTISLIQLELDAVVASAKALKINNLEIPVAPNINIWTGDAGRDVANYADLQSRIVKFRSLVQQFKLVVDKATKANLKSSTIKCVKGKLIKMVTNQKPKCPSGYKKS